MKYSIWRVSPDGSSFPITTAGETSLLDRAYEKVRSYNEMLRKTDPTSRDRYVVMDDKGRLHEEENLERFP